MKRDTMPVAQGLKPQTQALKAILERLEPQKPQPLPDTAGTG
jgi:hypothetical protein